MQEEETALTTPFDKAKHISQIGDLLILLALERLKWEANGFVVAEVLNDFHIKIDCNYIRGRHHAKPELFGKHAGGLLKVSDPQIKQQVKFLLRVIKVLPFWKQNAPPPMCIRDDKADYFAWTPSSFGIQAASDEEREAEESRRKDKAVRRGKHEKDLTNPLFD